MDAPAAKFRICPTCRQIRDGELLFCPKDGARLGEMAGNVLAGKFILGPELGAGSMGRVFEAEQPAMERQVAIKLLHPERTRDRAVVERFEREARAAGKISHPNVITIYESDRTPEGQVYLAMERLHGEGLAALLRREGRLPPERAIPLWMQAVRGMAAAHQGGVVHRDLKPENLFLVRPHDDGTDEQIKVLDFGIAKLQTRHPADEGTQQGTVLGTPRYMAPEQLAGQPVDARADVYALGLILVEMLSGRLPWGRGGPDEPLAVLGMRLTRPPQPLADLCLDLAVPEEWQQLLDQALALDPEARPPHAGDLLARARQALSAAPLPWPQRTQVMSLPRPAEVAAPDGAMREAGTDETTPALAVDPAALAAEPLDHSTTNRFLRAPEESLHDMRPVSRTLVVPRAARHWPGVAIGLAVSVLVAIYLVWPRPGPEEEAPTRSADLRPPRRVETPVQPPQPQVIPMPAPPPQSRQDPNPVKPGTQALQEVTFHPHVPPGPVTLSCPPRKPQTCTPQKPCTFKLPPRWKCTASDPAHQPYDYKQQDLPLRDRGKKTLSVRIDLYSKPPP